MAEPKDWRTLTCITALDAVIFKHATGWSTEARPVSLPSRISQTTY